MQNRPWMGGCLAVAAMAVAMALFGARVEAQGVDPAVVGERLQRLAAAVESLELSLASQKRQIELLGAELHKVREEMVRQGDAVRQNASQRPWADDIRRLAEGIAEVDRKRASDGEQVVKVLNDLKRAVASSAEAPKVARPAGNPSGGGATKPGAKATEAGGEKGADKPPEKVLDYVLERGQRLSDVVSSFNEEARKQGYQTLSVSQVMRFNNIKDDKKIREGTKILLPVVPAR